MRLTPVLIIVLLAISGVVYANGLNMVPELQVPKAGSAPIIDGKLDDSCWQAGQPVSLSYDLAGNSPDELAQAWMAYDKDGLYVAFKCMQSKMLPGNSPSSKEVWNDDSVEVFLYAASGHDRYNHFMINAAGAKAYEIGNGRGWFDRSKSPKWNAVAKIHDGYWVVEMSIPYETLGVKFADGLRLRGNLCRNQPAKHEHISWSPLRVDFHQPLAFGNIILGKQNKSIALSAKATGSLGRGKVDFRAWCRNETESDVKLVAEVYQLGRKPIKHELPIAAGGKQITKDFDIDIKHAGAINLRLSALDAGNGKLLHEVNYSGIVHSTCVPGWGGVISSGTWGALWSSTGTFKVRRDTDAPKSTAESIKISAARNEFEPFQLVIRPSKDLANVKVEPRTLKGPKGAKIDAWNMTVRKVEYVEVKESTSGDSRPGTYPDPLPPFEPFTARKGVNNPVWINLYVPPTAAPGDYEGTVDVMADGMPKVIVPIKLRVWDFKLPSVSALKTAYGGFSEHTFKFHGAKTPEEMRKLTELYNIEFWRHRISPFDPAAHMHPTVSMEGNSVKVDFTHFDEAIKKYFHLFNTFNLPNFGANWDLGFGWGENYERHKIDYMRIVAEHVAAKGQLEKAYNYIYDEPEEKHYSMVKNAAKLCKMADQRIKVLLTEQVEPELAGSVDIWVPMLNAYDEKRAKERQAKGEEVWWYVCCAPHHPYPNYFIDYPAVDHRILPWLTWKYKVDGILYWNVTYWLDNPWDVAMSYWPDRKGTWGNGDGRLLYPPTRTIPEKFTPKPPIPSLRWEIIREGMEDYEYFIALRDAIARAEKAGKPAGSIEKAKKALEAVNSCVESTTLFTNDPSKLESVRSRIAEAIESLN